MATNFSRASKTRTHEQLLHQLARHLKAALPLAERVLSDEFSAEEREQLRKLVPARRYRTGGIFFLNNALVGLCGERARSMMYAEWKAHRDWEDELERHRKKVGQERQNP